MPTVTTFYLEMLAPPAGEPGPSPSATRVMRAHRPTTAFYRFLYREVGRIWHWVDREKLDDDALAEILHHPDVHVHVLYWDGTPAGYCELDYRQPDEAEIVYFGLMPHAIRRGLGRFFLDWTIGVAARHPPPLGAHLHARPPPRARHVPAGRVHPLPRRDAGCDGLKRGSVPTCISS